MFDIYSRMKSATRATTDKELAKYLGLSSPGVISMWKKREQKPYKECELISKKENVMLDWLISGEGEKYKLKQPVVANTFLSGDTSNEMGAQDSPSTDSALDKTNKLCAIDLHLKGLIYQQLEEPVYQKNIVGLDGLVVINIFVDIYNNSVVFMGFNPSFDLKLLVHSIVHAKAVDNIKISLNYTRTALKNAKDQVSKEHIGKLIKDSEERLKELEEVKPNKQ